MVFSLPGARPLFFAVFQVIENSTKAGFGSPAAAGLGYRAP